MRASRPYVARPGERVTVRDRTGALVCDVDAAVLTTLVRRLVDAERARDNLVQDACENAMVPVSLLDAMKQALAGIVPDHPALQTYAPSFGTWELLSRDNTRLRDINRRWQQAYAALRNVPCDACDGCGMIGGDTTVDPDNALRPCPTCCPSTETNNHE